MKIILFDLLTGGHHIKYASYLIKFLLDHGDEVIFVSWKHHARIDNILGVHNQLKIEYVVNESNGKISDKIVIKLIQMIRGLIYCFRLANKFDVDIVHVLYLERFEISLLLSKMMVKKRSWKLFATLFWPYYDHKPFDNIGLIKKIYHTINKRISEYLLKKNIMNGLFVHTNNIRKVLIKHFNMKQNDERIIVTPDPVDSLDKYSLKKARNMLDLPQSGSIILFFGGLRWDKGPDIFLKALRYVENDFYALIAGQPDAVNGQDVHKYMENVKDASILITRFGYIPEEDIAKYFSSSDAVVLPYRRTYKGTSGVLQYAAAANKPVIAANVGEIGRIVSEYELGIIVEPNSSLALANKIDYFLSHKEEISEMVKANSPKYSKENSYKITAKIVRDVYNSGKLGVAI